MNEVLIPSLAGHNIPATYNKANENHKICILSHGIFVDREENGRFKRLTDRLAAVNISTIRFDLSGHGESPITSNNASVVTMAAEIADVVKYAKNRFPNAEISLVLSSFSGALFSIFNVALGSSAVDKFVFLNPVLDFNNVFINAQKAEMAELFSIANLETCFTEGSFMPSPHFSMNRSFVMEMASTDVPSLYSRFNKKHLVIHGTGDELVDYDHTKTICENNDFCKFRTIDEAQHAFMKPEHEISAHKILIEWLDS